MSAMVTKPPILIREFQVCNSGALGEAQFYIESVILEHVYCGKGLGTYRCLLLLRNQTVPLR